MTDDQQYYDAQELWQTQVPYFEPDKVENTVRTMLHVGLWRVRLNLTRHLLISTRRRVQTYRAAE